MLITTLVGNVMLMCRQEKKRCFAVDSARFMMVTA